MSPVSKDIVQYLTLQSNAHHRNYISDDNSNDTQSYSNSGTTSSLKFTTSLSWQLRQHRSRSVFQRRSRSIRSTVSRPSKIGWWQHPKSIRTFILRSQGWRSNLFATRISTTNEPNRTLRSFWKSTKPTSGYKFTIETLWCTQFWNENSYFKSNLQERQFQGKSKKFTSMTNSKG